MSTQVLKTQSIINFVNIFSVYNAVALGECGRLPLCVTYIMNCSNYWSKLMYGVDIDIQRIVIKC